MSVKADLRVILGLDKAGFDRSLASATSSVNRFKKQTQMAKKDIGTLLGGAGYMEYYVQRHGDQAQFAYTVMSGCLLAVVVLTLLIRALGIHGKKKAAPPAA